MPLVSFIIMPAGVLSGLAFAFGLEALPLRVMGAGLDAVLAISRWIAGLPHADRPIAAFGPLTLGLLALGLFWAVIWRGRWRYAGAAAALVPAFAVGAMQTGPDVYIDREGSLAAVRGSDGVLVFAARRKAGFVIETWLRRAGDPRPLSQGLRAIERCAGQQCRATATTASGVRVTVSIQMEGQDAMSACQGATIAVLTDYRSVPPGCTAPLVVTRQMLEARGALSVRISPQERGAGIEESRGKASRTPAGSGHPSSMHPSSRYPSPGQTDQAKVAIGQGANRQRANGEDGRAQDGNQREMRAEARTPSIEVPGIKVPGMDVSGANDARAWRIWHRP